MAYTVIDAKELLEGKRMRKLTLKPRLYYPLLQGMSNIFARIELDFDLLQDKLATYRDPDAANVADWFREYEQNKLVFVYPGNDVGAEEPSVWAQFDVRTDNRRKFATSEESESPAPPEPDYTKWLQAIHGEEWKAFHITNYQQERSEDISAKRVEAGKKGAAATNAKRWGVSVNQQNVGKSQQTNFAESASQQSRLVDGVEAVNVDVDVDEVVIYSLNNEGTEQRITGKDSISSTITSSEKKANDNESEFPSDPEECAEHFVDTFDHLVSFNPSEDASVRKKGWRSLWQKDFGELLNKYAPEELLDIIILSQAKHNQKYYVRPAGLVKSAASLLDQAVVMKKEQPKVWRVLCLTYSKHMGSSSSVQEELPPNTPSPPTVNVENSDSQPVPLRAWFSFDDDGWIKCSHCGCFIEPDNAAMLEPHLKPHLVEENDDLDLGEDDDDEIA